MIIGHGRCAALYKCDCDPGWTGVSCALPDCAGTNHCSGQGECVTRDTCQCYPGFQGANCSKVAECTQFGNCSGNGVCTQEKHGGNLTCRSAIQLKDYSLQITNLKLQIFPRHLQYLGWTKFRRSETKELVLNLNIIHTVYLSNDLLSLVTTLSQLLLKLRLLSCHRLSPISQAICCDDCCSVIRVTLESPTPVSSAVIGFGIILWLSFSSYRFVTKRKCFIIDRTYELLIYILRASLDLVVQIVASLRASP